MFENNTDRMFWTIAVFILGATLLMIGNKAFPKAQESIMTTISQNIETENNSASNLTAATNPDSKEAKIKNFSALKDYEYDYNSDGTINLTNYKKYNQDVDIPKWGPAKNSSNIKDAVKITTLNKNDNTIGPFGGKNITSAKIPDSIKIIGRNSFGWNRLKTINIPDSVTSMTQDAFTNNQLTYVNIPDSVKFIGRGVFNNNKLTDVNLSKSIDTISQDGFGGNQFTHLILPQNIKRLNPGAFRNNAKLSSVYIPDSITYIDNWAFRFTNIKKVNIPKSVSYLHSAAFDDNTKITKLSY